MSLFQGIPEFGTVLLSLIGIVIAVMWNRNIISYKNLNNVKFKIIQEIEDELPVTLFKREEEEYKKKGHKHLTSIELSIPWLFALAFGLNICYTLLFV